MRKAFEYQQYNLDEQEIIRLGRVVLSDTKQVFEVTEILESYPPQIGGLEEVKHSLHNESVEEIARIMHCFIGQRK